MTRNLVTRMNTIAQIIKLNDELGLYASSLPCVRELVKQTGAIFLLIHEYNGELHYELRTRSKMNFANGKIPPGYFHKASSDFELHILKKEKRTREHVKNFICEI